MPARVKGQLAWGEQSVWGWGWGGEGGKEVGGARAHAWDWEGQGGTPAGSLGFPEICFQAGGDTARAGQGLMVNQLQELELEQCSGPNRALPTPFPNRDPAPQQRTFSPLFLPSNSRWSSAELDKEVPYAQMPGEGAQGAWG